MHADEEFGRIGASTVAALAGLLLGALLLFGTFRLALHLMGDDPSPSDGFVRGIGLLFVACVLSSSLLVALLVRALAVRLNGFVAPTVAAVLALFAVSSIITYGSASNFMYCNTCTATSCSYSTERTFPLIGNHDQVVFQLCDPS